MNEERYRKRAISDWLHLRCREPRSVGRREAGVGGTAPSLLPSSREWFCLQSRCRVYVESERLGSDSACGPTRGRVPAERADMEQSRRSRTRSNHQACSSGRSGSGGTRRRASIDQSALSQSRRCCSWDRSAHIRELAWLLAGSGERQLLESRQR